jgi:hypothetical protein
LSSSSVYIIIHTCTTNVLVACTTTQQYSLQLTATTERHAQYYTAVVARSISYPLACTTLSHGSGRHPTLKQTSRRSWRQCTRRERQCSHHPCWLRFSTEHPERRSPRTNGSRSCQESLQRTSARGRPEPWAPSRSIGMRSSFPHARFLCFHGSSADVRPLNEAVRSNTGRAQCRIIINEPRYVIAHT